MKDCWQQKENLTTGCVFFPSSSILYSYKQNDCRNNKCVEIFFTKEMELSSFNDYPYIRVLSLFNHRLVVVKPSYSCNAMNCYSAYIAIPYIHDFIYINHIYIFLVKKLGNGDLREALSSCTRTNLIRIQKEALVLQVLLLLLVLILLALPMCRSLKTISSKVPIRSSLIYVKSAVLVQYSSSVCLVFRLVLVQVPRTSCTWYCTYAKD